MGKKLWIFLGLLALGCGEATGPSRKPFITWDIQTYDCPPGSTSSDECVDLHLSNPYRGNNIYLHKHEITNTNSLDFVVARMYTPFKEEYGCEKVGEECVFYSESLPVGSGNLDLRIHISPEAYSRIEYDLIRDSAIIASKSFLFETENTR